MRPEPASPPARRHESAGRPAHEWIWYVSAAVLVTALTGTVYSRVIHAPFVFDDAIVTQARATQATTLSQVGDVLRSRLPRPLTRATFALNFCVGWLDPTGYHLVNLALHAVNGFLAFALVLALLECLPEGHVWRPRARLIALGAAAVWLVHPVQTQAVSYVWQRSTSLCAAFYLAALIAFVRGRRSGGARRLLLFALAAASGWAALSSKENAGSLPGALLLVELAFFQTSALEGRPSSPRRAVVAALLAVAALAAIAATYLGPRFAAMMTADFARRGFTLGERLLTEARVVVHYLGLLAVPLPGRLTLDYDVQVSRGLLSPPATAFCAASVVGLVLGAVALLRRAPLVAFPVLWFFGLLAIESTVVPLDLAYEHRLYLPSVMPVAFAVALFLGGGAERLAWRGEIPALVLLVALLGAWSWQRNEVWRDPVLLWSDTAEKSPNKARVHTNLGKALLDSGDAVGALAAFRRAVALDPTTVEPLNGQATVYLDHLGDIPAARAILDRLAAEAPSYLPARTNLGVAEMRAGDLEAAIVTFESVLRQEPQDPNATYNLAAVHLNARRYGRAKALLESGLAAWPGHTRMRALLALVHVAEGDLAGADRALAPAEARASDDRMVAAARAEIARRRRGEAKVGAPRPR